MATSYYATALEPPSLAGLPTAEAYIAQHHAAHISWHITLNNHMSTRPKMYGGKLVPSVTDSKTFTQIVPGSASASAPSSASANWHCSLDLPNSFAPGDGLRLQAEGFGRTKDEASELACRQAVARLLVENPSQVVLRPKRWNIPITDLLVGMPSADAPHQALPVHVPARSREAGADAQVLSAAEVDDRVAEILRQCLTTHGGSFDPSRISHKAVGLGPADERMYSRLNKLLLPEGLRPWVEKHPEFAWARSGAKAMVITWGWA